VFRGFFENFNLSQTSLQVVHCLWEVKQKMTNGNKSSRDQRSNSKNPNNVSYKAAMDNRSSQLNPNNEAYESSEDEEEDE